jgi:SpoIVB peptidase S55
MLTRGPHPSDHAFFSRLLLAAALALTVFSACSYGQSARDQPADATPAQAPVSAALMPLSEVRAGMNATAYTIFAGSQVEAFPLDVIGIMPNFLGPGQAIILVQLKGAKAEHTGVVAGMSGSPVYINGKLAGALSLKLGTFTKEPIGGVTPIEDVIHPQQQLAQAEVAPALQLTLPDPTTSGNISPNVASQSWPSGSSLEPIETPLIFSGIQPETLRVFASQLQSYGLVAAQGGTSSTPGSSADKHLLPGDMAGMVLVQGDLSISSACTVTAVHADDVYLCGHPFLSLGSVQMPLARTEVLTTLSSDLASTKIINVGEDIGTITTDRLTAVTGKLGAPPPMIPLNVTLAANGSEKKLHFELMNHPKITPLLVGITLFNGLTQNNLYSEGTTLHLSATIRIHGHAPVQIESTYAPGDIFTPDGIPVAINIQSVFARLFSNTHELPVFDDIDVHVDSRPGRNSFNIESAWLEKGEAAPGENIRVRVLLRPYRAPERVEQATIHVPDQAPRGSTLRVLVCDGDLLNRSSRGFGFSGPGANTGLDQLISVLNQERRNDRLYIGIFDPSPTLLWDDKELPNMPLSQINVIDGRPTPGTVQVLRESLASEASIPLGGPVSGVISLNLQIR